MNELDTQLDSERRGRDALAQARDDAHAAREEAEQRANQLELQAAEAQAEADTAHQQRCVPSPAPNTPEVSQHRAHLPQYHLVHSACSCPAPA